MRWVGVPLDGLARPQLRVGRVLRRQPLRVEATHTGILRLAADAMKCEVKSIQDDSGEIVLFKMFW